MKLGKDQFPIASVTSYCELSGVKQQKGVLSQVWVPEQKPVQGARRFPPGPLGKHLSLPVRRWWLQQADPRLCGCCLLLFCVFSLCLSFTRAFGINTNPDSLGKSHLKIFDFSPFSKTFLKKTFTFIGSKQEDMNTLWRVRFSASHGKGGRLFDLNREVHVYSTFCEPD